MRTFIPLLQADPFADFGDYLPPPYPESAAPPTWLHFADGGLLLLLLAFGTFIVLRKLNRRWLWAAQGAGLAWFGFFRHGCLCPVGAIGNVATAAFHPGFTLGIMAVVFFILPLAFALLVGRVYCGAACPMGTMQDILAFRVKPGRKRLAPKWERILGLGRWIFLGVAVVSAAAQLGWPICKFDPFVPVFRHAGPLSAWILTAAFLSLCLFTHRPYCRWVCPYAPLLGLLSRVAWRSRTISPTSCSGCRMCERQCPVNCIEKGAIMPGECILCGKCAEECRKEAVSLEPVKTLWPVRPAPKKNKGDGVSPNTSAASPTSLAAPGKSTPLT